MPSNHLNRRELLALSGAAVAARVLSRPGSLFAQVATTPPPTTMSASTIDHRYGISASDWMMLKRQTPGALDRGNECGLDGVEVDMGPLGKRPTFENKFRDEKFLADYLAKAKGYNLAISSLAMSAFYGQPVADHPKAEEFCAEWIDLMPKLGTKVGFLPVIFAKEEDRTAVLAKVVELMKKVAPKAESAGVVIGLNTPLNAEANVKLLDDIGSPAVRIAYNCGEAVDDKRDPLVELKALGKDRIAQIIPTLSDGKWLQNDDRLDVPKLKQQLDEMGWSGWLVLQRSRDAAKARDVKYNFGANAAYLKSIFQAAEKS
jgi:sugar phosphate isomerase/epimerase